MWTVCCTASLIAFTWLQVATQVSSELARSTREAPELTAGNWKSCQPGEERPATRIDTSDRVYQLRTYFATMGIHAYVIPNEDAHQSEYPSAYDKRRGFISGFQGSAGFAVVTINKQALWTDGRYFLEAEDTLDCNWILMREREMGVPSMADWLVSELSPGQKIGASPFLIANAKWAMYKNELSMGGLVLQEITRELVDNFWRPQIGRPLQPDTPINALPLEFAGRSWQDKVSDVRAEMAATGADMLVVTALDETAWLFNLRANDISYNPFFLSYAIVEDDKTTLFLLNHTHKINAEPTDKMTSTTVATHLNTNADGTCTGRTGHCVEVKLYDPVPVLNYIHTRSRDASRVWLSYFCNQAIYFSVPESKIVLSNTPIATAKTKKNPIEVEGMKKSHIRDAVALISFLAKLEKEVKAGVKWTELSAANALAEYRYKQKNNRGLSFDTISSSGANGAIIHYSVSSATDTPITTSDMYLLDSGGQYLDGTTDVTRTFHFGTPTQFQKECYTLVMMGHINLFQAVWPKGLFGREIDAFARAPMWDAGLIYRHGTGHGIGMYLSVHEGPGRISLSHALTKSDFALDEMQFFSDEPGYYEDGQFGIRLENIVMVTNATTKYHFPGVQFLTFEHITIVPYAPNLIEVGMLNAKQIKYLNDYNLLCRETIGPLLKDSNNEAYDWLIAKTQPIATPAAAAYKTSSSSTSVQFQNSLALTVMLLFALRLCS